MNTPESINEEVPESGSQEKLEGPTLSPEAESTLKEAKERLHPLLKEALKSDLIANGIVQKIPIADAPIQIDLQNAFEGKENLMKAIDRINRSLTTLMKVVEDPSARLWPRAGRELIEQIAHHSYEFTRSGILPELIMALDVLAKTKLREAAKSPTQQPFDVNQFEREKIIHQIMNAFQNSLYGVYSSSLESASQMIHFPRSG